MIKLSHILAEKRVSYKFKSINGGFSDGVSVTATETPGVVTVSVNIYGGGTGTADRKYRVPQKIANYQATYLKTIDSNEPITNDVAARIEAYKQDIKNAISIALYPILKEFDAKCSDAIGQAMAQVNKKYGAVPAPAPTELPVQNLQTKPQQKQNKGV